MRFRRKRWLWIAGLSAAAWGATGADSRIADAAEKSDWAAVRSLLHQHAGVNGAQADGSTALHWAAQRDNLEAADLLLAAGANVKAATRFNITPLALACTNGDAAIIDHLLKAGADANSTSQQGQTALMTASLTGKIDAATKFASTDFRASFPRFTPEAREANQALVDLLNQIAQRKKATPAQIAIAWLLAQKPWIVPIPGTRKLERVKENIGAAEVQLTPSDLAEIATAASKINVQGARLPEAILRMSGR